jgi:DNA-binding NarL/FixJ family response regulator
MKRLTVRLEEALKREAKAKRVLAAERKTISGLLKELSEQRYGHKLSSAEEKVLEMLHQGKTDKEIAAEMGRSVRTVKWHVSNLLKIFGFGSRIQFYEGQR